MKSFFLKYIDIFCGFGLVLIAFICALPNLDFTSLSIDEPFSVFYAQYDFLDIIQFLKGGNNPPGFEIFLHFWMKIAGQSVFWLRFPSAVFWGGTSVVLYFIGKEVFNRQVGVVGALTFILSSFTIQFAHQVRAYALFGFLATLSLLFLIRFLKSEKKSWLIALAVVNVLAAYVHFLAFIPIAAEFMVVAVYVKSDRKKWFPFLLSIASTLLLYLPMISVLISRADDSIRNGTWVVPVFDQLIYWRMISFMINGEDLFFDMICVVIGIASIRLFINESGWKRLVFPAALMCILGYIGIYFKSEELLIGLNRSIAFSVFSFVFIVLMIVWVGKEKLQGIVHGWFWVLYSGMFIASFWVPMFVERYFYVFVPAFFVSLAASFDRLLTLKKVSGAWLLVFFFLNSYKPVEVEHRDIKGLSSYLKAHTSSRNTTVFCADYFNVNLAYYLDRSAFNALNPKLPEYDLNQKLKALHFFPINNFSNLDTVFLDQQDTINYVDAYADFAYPGNGIYQTLNSRYQ